MDKSPTFPEFYIGAPVDASDLRYRDAFIDDLWEMVRIRHVLLTAPRRTGKTSIMDHLREFPRHEFAVIYENVQDLSHPADFFGSLLGRFHDEHPKFFRDTLGFSWGLVKTALGKVKDVGFSEFKVALRESDPDWKKNWRTHGEKFLQDFEGILDDAGLELPAHQRKQQFNQLLRDLENDFYVSEITPDVYDFASGILKSWWKKYYA